MSKRKVINDFDMYNFDGMRGKMLRENERREIGYMWYR